MTPLKEKAISIVDAKIHVLKSIIEEMEEGRLDGCLECRKHDLEDFETILEVLKEE